MNSLVLANTVKRDEADYACTLCCSTQ